jgi:hypothetical protein
MGDWMLLETTEKSIPEHQAFEDAKASRIICFNFTAGLMTAAEFCGEAK